MRTPLASAELDPRAVKRVALVVLDGLRPDAITAFGMRHLSELMRRGASSLRATTVAPSVTTACLASLFTGVTPEVHGLRSSRVQLVRRDTLYPIPRALAERSLSTFVYRADVPWFMRRIAGRLATALGVNATFTGKGAADILDAALPRIDAFSHGLMFLHWPDTDDVGHRHGWMSGAYCDAARRMDAALGTLMEAFEVFERDDTLMIALADHGGGGVNVRDHDSAHPLDRTIPLVLAGGGIAPRVLREPVSLLDVPPTVLWALGVPVPAVYSGRPLVEVFGREEVAA